MMTQEAETGSRPIPAQPVVRAAKVEDIRIALQLGWQDFAAAPVYGLFFGGFYTVGGLLIMLLVLKYEVSYLAYPLVMGFVLIAPFVAAGLYEVSRRRESRLPLYFSPVMATIWRQGGLEMGWMAFVTLFFFIIWMYQVRLLLALFLGFQSFASIGDFLTVLVSTSDGLMFLGVGNLVGAGLALVLFSLTVVSFPLLLDRDVDFITAMITSVRAVTLSPVVMIGWGLVITVMTILAMAPAFLGLLVVLPVLGHATWHLFRRLVEPLPVRHPSV